MGSPAFSLCVVPLANTVTWMWQGDERKPLFTKDLQGSALFSVQEQGPIKLVPCGQPILLIPALFSYQARPVSKVFKVPKYPLIWKRAVMLVCSTFLSWTPEKLSVRTTASEFGKAQKLTQHHCMNEDLFWLFPWAFPIKKHTENIWVRKVQLKITLRTRMVL